jgi:hypothetical protein
MRAILASLWRILGLQMRQPFFMRGFMYVLRSASVSAGGGNAGAGGGGGSLTGLIRARAKTLVE